jgi:UDP-N-acetylglucosamine 1-carboxyvinyltransferase
MIKSAGVINLGMTIKMFEKLGCRFEITGDDIKVLKQENYTIQKMHDGSMMTIYSAPWPMISPDILSVGVVAALQSEGSVLFHEKMYEARMFFVDKLVAMKGSIVLCDPHRVVVNGNNWKERLHARNMTSPDIRAGIALLIAALGAEGESVIDNIDQIDRGYENIEMRLAALGADVVRV